jgi:hypothetical protein
MIVESLTGISRCGGREHAIASQAIQQFRPSFGDPSTAYQFGLF